MDIQVGSTTLTATMEDNSTSHAFRELLAGGPMTLDLMDYGGMEKGAYLDGPLPTEHSQIAPGPGDIMLYEDNVFLIYYNDNSAWPYTRLGRIDNAADGQIRDLFGSSGNVTVTLSLDESGK